jgi:manganese oxidase
MGHHAANLVGADTRGLDAKIRSVTPGYMTMGASGMGEMATMRMSQPRNSVSMVGGDGPHGVIDMGGMFTIVKVRERLSGDGDPGWYNAPKPSIAKEASRDELARDGITP